MRYILISLIVLTVAGGCESPEPEQADPVPEPVIEAQDVQGTFEYMVDNALLADMTIADYHFVPHRALLTPLGEQRLLRLATLIESYGGVIRYNTDLDDGALLGERTRTIIDFLAANGADTTADILTREMSGGVGMEAREAILIKSNEATYKPSSTSGGTSVPPGVGVSSGTP